MTVLGLKMGPSNADRFVAGLEEVGAEVVTPPRQWYRRLPPAAVLWIERQVRNLEPDIVHSHLPAADILVHLWRRAFRREMCVVASVHGWEPRLTKTVNRRLLNWAYSGADEVIVISRWLQQAVRELGVKRSTNIVYYGIHAPIASDSDVEQVREKLNLRFGSRATIVGSLARLVPQKGLETLIDAVADLPREYVAVVVGADEGEHGNLLRRRVSDRALDDRVWFAGFQANAAAWLRAVDLFCLPSRWEGLGLVLLEAGAIGTPIVASDIAPINELVVNDQHGLLAPVDDASAFANALSRLSHDHALRETLTAAMKSRVSVDFAHERMVREVFEVYDRALATT